MRRTFRLMIASAMLGAFYSVAALAGPGGTTLRASKTAEATSTRTERYTWILDKSTPPNQVPYVIPEGESALVQFTITATRSGPTVTFESGPVTGQICLLNTGAATTSGLHIVDRLEVLQDEEWVQFTTPIVIPVSSELAAGATRCFPYVFATTTLDRDKEYRNHAVISIDNYLGHEGEAHEIDVFADLDLEEVNTVIDATATLSDTFSCPEGFTCVESTFESSITGTISIPFTVTMTNDSVGCGSTLIVQNSASLDPATTHVVLNDSASVTVFTGTCPEPNPGCTRTQGFWGNKQGEALIPLLVPVSMNLGTPTYTAAQLISILGGSSPGNALFNLANQLIAARLNVLAGASVTPIAATLLAADAAIGALIVPPVGSGFVLPSSTLGQQMDAIKTTLDQYNNGLLGVPHCD